MFLCSFEQANALEQYIVKNRKEGDTNTLTISAK